ncbi:MAG: uroporphyrinogen-III synthase [Rhodospirillaceae bacterium]
MACVLITRPREDAEALATILESRDHRVLIEPMLEIVYRDDPGLVIAGLQGLLFTSANGVRAFERASADRTLPVYAVGDSTAGAARAAGFATVLSAAGDVGALAERVAAQCRPGDGALLHVAASVLAGDLSALLERAGFSVRREVLYEARPAARLSAETAAALAAEEIDSVLLYSPRTAWALVGLVKMAGLEAACAGVTALCLSAAVAEAATALSWRTVLVAERPDRTSILALI